MSKTEEIVRLSYVNEKFNYELYSKISDICYLVEIGIMDPDNAIEEIASLKELYSDPFAVKE